MKEPDFIREKLLKREQEGLLRKLIPNQQLIDFASNDYLGLANSLELHDRLNSDFPLHGSTGSRLLTGNSDIALNLEKKLALFHQADESLLFNSCYDANLGLFSAISGKSDVVLYDDKIHASIKDGARLGLGRHFSFRHNDVNHLEQKLKAIEGNVFIAVESVYSMDGDMAPLKEIVELIDKYSNAYLIVDEAHATGVFGTHGEGLVQLLGLESKCFARLHTFGKAMGCHGALILCNDNLKQYLINFARSLIYTTAIPYSSLIAIEEAYELMHEKPGLREQLHKIIGLFTKLAKEKGLQFIDSYSTIQCIIIPGNETCKSAAKAIQEAGYDVRPILSPTVPKGQERLRICLHTFNTVEQVNGLIDQLALLV